MNAVSFAVAAPLVALLSYLLGSLPFAVIVSKIMGLQDPRTFGSKNPGATNVLRSGNKKAAVLTLLGDAFKGWLAVFLTQQAISNWGWAPTLLGVSAFLPFWVTCTRSFWALKAVKAWQPRWVSSWPCCPGWLWLPRPPG